MPLEGLPYIEVKARFLEYFFICPKLVFSKCILFEANAQGKTEKLILQLNIAQKFEIFF